MFEEAVFEYEWIYNEDPLIENKRLLENAKMKLKISKKKDYYEILCIRKTAGIKHIRIAYKELALKYHPDRHPNASESKKKELDKTMKDINEAYDVLSDPNKRFNYDHNTQ